MGSYFAVDNLDGIEMHASEANPNSKDSVCFHECKDPVSAWRGMTIPPWDNGKHLKTCPHGFRYKGHKAACAPLYPGGYCDC